jgi:hypothetical protein
VDQFFGPVSNFAKNFIPSVLGNSGEEKETQGGLAKSSNGILETGRGSGKTVSRALDSSAG